MIVLNTKLFVPARSNPHLRFSSEAYYAPDRQARKINTLHAYDFLLSLVGSMSICLTYIHNRKGFNIGQNINRTE